MNFISLEFLFFVLLAIVLLRLTKHARINLWILSGLSATFFLSFFSSIQTAFPILSMIGFGYVFLHIVRRFSRYAALGICIAIMTLAFIWFKQYSFIKTLFIADTLSFVTVGLSYVLFRILHLLIDVSQGNKRVPPILEYLNYCLFFPTFVSGPIQRYDDFESQLCQSPAPLTVSALHHALCRILLGIILVVVCSAYAQNAMNWLKDAYFINAKDDAKELKTIVIFAMTSFATLCKLYTNFSGSMHIIIGLGALLGFTLPENFNKPYLAKNFLDFWGRWHITLSEWIKFYLFNPLLKWLIQRFPHPRAEVFLGAIAFFVSFLVIGIWHGSTILFVLFGVMLGIGATTNKLWQQLCTKMLGKKIYKSLVTQNWYFQISRGLTLGYIATALICLWFEPEAMNIDLLKIMVCGFILLSLSLALFGGIMDAIVWSLHRLRIIQSLSTVLRLTSERAMMLWMGIMLWIVANHIGAFGSNIPEFVYKGF